VPTQFHGGDANAANGRSFFSEVGSSGTSVDFTPMYRAWGYSPDTVELLEESRRLAPSRSVGGGAGNVTGRMICWPNGTTVDYESRSVEYFLYIRLNFDREVLAVYPQPPPVKVTYRVASGRLVSVWITFDALVFWTYGAGFIECKNAERLAQIEKKAPDMYSRDSDGNWTSPAARRVFDPMGLRFHVYCPGKDDANFVRNADFIGDYCRSTSVDADAADVMAVVDCVRRAKRILLAELLADFMADDVYVAIAKQKVFFDWHNSLLRAPEATWIYAEADYAKNMTATTKWGRSACNAPPAMRAGTTLSWNGEVWRIVQVQQDHVTLIDERKSLLSVALPDMQARFASGEMRMLEAAAKTPSQRAAEVLAAASSSAVESAMKRLEKLRAYEAGDRKAIAGRTARDWQRKTRDAAVEFDMPLLGLLHRNSKKGNRSPKSPQRSRELAMTVLEEHFETKTKPTLHAAYRHYQNACEDQGIAALSWSTFWRMARQRCSFKQVASRDGRRMAIQIHGPRIGDHNSTPPNGDRAWELAHIDHTPSDVTLISTVTGEVLGVPWLTFLTDAFTRMILAIWVSFLNPSHVALMMVIRDCVRRWGRLPSTVVCDGGPDFRSGYFERLLALLGCNKRTRAKGEPRHGSVAERIFRTKDTQFANVLRGNTQQHRLHRSRSRTHDPKRLACWTPHEFERALNEWCFEVYPNNPHVGVLETPRQRLDRSLELSGSRSFTAIAYDESFLNLTLPEAPGKLTRKVRGGTVRLLNMEYRGAKESISGFDGQKGPVRFDPFNPSHAVIELAGEYRSLICTNDVLREYMEREVKCAHLEISARARTSRRNYREGSPELRAFLRRVEATERALVSEKRAATVCGAERKGAAADVPPPLPVLPKANVLRVATLRENL
jgi:transposase InsO family protein